MSVFGLKQIMQCRSILSLFVKQIVDYEQLPIEDKRLTFDLKVFDAGIPEKSADAIVIVDIKNLMLFK